VRSVGELGRREILVDYRSDAGLRMSPHFLISTYTSEAELKVALRAIHELIDSGSAAAAGPAVRF
jgi:hypothetical protein